MENNVQDILVKGLEKANDKLDTLLERTAKTKFRARFNSIQLYAIWGIIGTTVWYIFECKGIFK